MGDLSKLPSWRRKVENKTSKTRRGCKNIFYCFLPITVVSSLSPLWPLSAVPVTMSPAAPSGFLHQSWWTGAASAMIPWVGNCLPAEPGWILPCSQRHRCPHSKGGIGDLCHWLERGSSEAHRGEGCFGLRCHRKLQQQGVVRQVGCFAGAGLAVLAGDVCSPPTA